MSMSRVGFLVGPSSSVGSAGLLSRLIIGRRRQQVVSRLNGHILWSVVPEGVSSFRSFGTVGSSVVGRPIEDEKRREETRQRRETRETRERRGMSERHLKKAILSIGIGLAVFVSWVKYRDGLLGDELKRLYSVMMCANTPLNVTKLWTDGNRKIKLALYGLVKKRIDKLQRLIETELLNSPHLKSKLSKLLSEIAISSSEDPELIKEVARMFCDAMAQPEVAESAANILSNLLDSEDSKSQVGDLMQSAIDSDKVRNAIQELTNDDNVRDNVAQAIKQSVRQALLPKWQFGWGGGGGSGGE